VTRYLRSRFAAFALDDSLSFDPVALLSGAPPARVSRARITAFSILTGKRHDLTPAELEVLWTLPADEWFAPDGADDSMLEHLVECGLAISDAPTPVATTLRERHEALSGTAWNRHAALYHYMTQWSGVALAEDPEGLAEAARAAARRLALANGPGPGPFADVTATRTIALPGIERTEPLYRTLVARRTARGFDESRSMQVADLDAVLRYVFGCHGHAPSALGTTLIRRTSPSAGALHAIEAYPIVAAVAGIEPGIYHYGVADHTLGLLRGLDARQAREMATAFMCGQNHLGAAHVTFVLTARFDRSYWKYREHPRAYAALLMDAAHLSQTLQLVSTDLGLRAFVTLVVNGLDIEGELGLDGAREGVMAIVGCGLPAETPTPFEMSFAPGPPPR
jgi:putative peptide maturation dehydrogenase